jgi:hypothetical protein
VARLSVIITESSLNPAAIRFRRIDWNKDATRVRLPGKIA